MRLKSETTALRIWKGVAFGNDKAECMTTGISGSSGEKYYLQRGGLGNGRPNGRIICVDFESTIITTRIVLEVQWEAEWSQSGPQTSNANMFWVLKYSSPIQSYWIGIPTSGAPADARWSMKTTYTLAQKLEKLIAWRSSRVFNEVGVKLHLNCKVKWGQLKIKGSSICKEKLESWKDLR